MTAPCALPEDGWPSVVRVSYRQYTVLRALLFDAASNAQIAKRLTLTEDTVKTHMRRIFNLLGVRDRQAVAIAVWSGAVDVFMVLADGSSRHLLEELRQLQYANVRKEEECPTTSPLSRPGTGSPPPSPTSTSTPVAT
jgi:DNA-binding CsgD family transcriptional regulator